MQAEYLAKRLCGLLLSLRQVPVDCGECGHGLRLVGVLQKPLLHQLDFGDHLVAPSHQQFFVLVIRRLSQFALKNSPKLANV